MNKAESLYILIKSLSKSERRYFRLYTNIQTGDKVYLSLFNLIEKDIFIDNLYTTFCQEQDGKNFEMAVKHLYKVLLDCLIRLRETQDSQTEIFNLISKAAILFERELYDEAFSQLNKAKKLAIAFENDTLLLLIRRTEIKYFSSMEFKSITERELVNKQMKINEVLKYTRNTNQHLQLYDVLKHRLIHKGYIRSEKQKEDLNDLVLSELHLISNNSYRGFEAQKLHHLFQATYYLNSGNYKSAIRFYKELIILFEENRHMLLNPPMYYLSALLGILDSLQVVRLYAEIPFFLTKLVELEKREYSCEFKLTVKAYIFQYEFAMHVNNNNISAAKSLIDSYEETLFKKINLISLETQLKLYISVITLYLATGELAYAKKNMKKIVAAGKLFYSLPSHKIARLVNLLLQAELGHYDFFENEIISIKRNIRYEKQLYITEKLVFKFVLSYPLPSYEKARSKLWLQFKKEIQKIDQNKYELQLLKTFDFLTWIESKLTRQPFHKLLAEKANNQV